jgi:hypothetical protein
MFSQRAGAMAPVCRYRSAVRLVFVVALVLLAVTRAAAAEVIQMPQGGRAVPVGAGRVVCGPLPEGWGIEGGGRLVRPPAGEGGSRAVEARVAGEGTTCAGSRETVTLQVTARWPQIDPASVVFAADEGRLEVHGQRLDGVQVVWTVGERLGQDRCVAPVADRRQQQCVIPLERLPVDAVLRWVPAGGRTGRGVTTYDAGGQLADPDTFVLRPARTLITRLLPPGVAVDISPGVGRVPLVHPRAVAAVDCGLARCELGEGGVVVRGVPGLATQVTIQLRLAPRFFLVGEKTETVITATLPILHCPLAVVSGAPLRDADETRMVVKMDERCGRDARLRWTVGAEPAEVGRTVRVDDAVFVELRAGRIAGGGVTVAAIRRDTDGIIGSVTARTAPAPRPHAAVELPGYGRIDFIPTNREAALSVSDPGEHASLVPLPIDGVYGVRRDRGRSMIRGDENASGLTSLRFGYRVDGLPADFAGINLAVLTEQVQRPVREASLPAPFEAAPGRPEPLVDLRCADAQGSPAVIAPGRPARIPYEARETCRVTLHQGRLRPEDGPQEVVLEIDVTRPDGAKRAEAAVNERLVLRPGGEDRTFYLKGVTGQFDHVVVRVSHVIDETRYVLSPAARQGLPSIQYSATVEGGWARLYATVAIPAGLYRMNEPTGQLTLNFGVLSRLTWLDRRGKEGILGLEIGLMGIGLIPQAEKNVTIPRTLAAVAGAGLRIDLGAGAAVGVHLWGAYEFRDDYPYRLQNPDDPASGRPAPHWAVFFGPSIAIGNAGTNL